MLRIARYRHEYCIDTRQTYRLTHIDLRYEHLVEYLQLHGFTITENDIEDVCIDDDNDRNYMATIEKKPIVVLTVKYPSKLKQFTGVKTPKCPVPKVSRFNHKDFLYPETPFPRTHIDLEAEHLLEYLKCCGINIEDKDVVGIATPGDSKRDWMIPVKDTVVIVTEKEIADLGV